MPRPPVSELQGPTQAEMTPRTRLFERVGTIFKSKKTRAGLAIGAGFISVLAPHAASADTNSDSATTSISPAHFELNPTPTPTETPTISPDQVPPQNWELKLTKDKTLPTEYAKGVRIESFDAIIENEPDKVYVATSLVSKGELITVPEEKINEFADIQIKVVPNGTPEENEAFNKKRSVWVYGGREEIGEGGEMRYAIQNDSEEPCEGIPGSILIRCPDTYTSKHAGKGNEEGARNYMVISVPKELNAVLGVLAHERTALSLEEIQKILPGVEIHDVSRITRLKTEE